MSTTTTATTITGDFDIEDWVEEPIDEAPGATIARITVTKAFTGGIVGTSTAHLVTGVTEVEGSAGYVGMERLAVTLDGKQGTFVLQHSAGMRDGAEHLDLTVIQDSGTGELAGITGTGQIDIGPGGEHSLTLTYELS